MPIFARRYTPANGLVQDAHSASLSSNCISQATGAATSRSPASHPYVADLAKTLGRDYKRVHEDVAALVHAGLIVRDENGICAPYDSVQAIVSLDV